jgi:hypothetical protein
MRLSKLRRSFSAILRTCTISFVFVILHLALAIHRAHRYSPRSAMLSLPQLRFLMLLRQNCARDEYVSESAFCRNTSRTQAFDEEFLMVECTGDTCGGQGRRKLRRFWWFPLEHTADNVLELDASSCSSIVTPILATSAVHGTLVSLESGQLGHYGSLAPKC